MASQQRKGALHARAPAGVGANLAEDERKRMRDGTTGDPVSDIDIDTIF
jgi:hypothetical protein